MPRRRDRGFLDALELWSPRAPTPKAAPAAFATIARTFEEIDLVMLDEIKADGLETSASPFIRNRLPESRDRDVMSYIQSVEEGTSHTSSEADVSAYLSDYKCITAWSWVHGTLLEKQGPSNTHYRLEWARTKSQANELLNLARAVLEIYESEKCQDLLIPGREGVGAGIEAKLRKLSSFDTIYRRPTDDAERNHIGPINHHSFCTLFNQFITERRENTKARREANYARAHQNVSKYSA